MRRRKRSSPFTVRMEPADPHYARPQHEVGQWFSTVDNAKKARTALIGAPFLDVFVVSCFMYMALHFFLLFLLFLYNETNLAYDSSLISSYIRSLPFITLTLHCECAVD